LRRISASISKREGKKNTEISFPTISNSQVSSIPFERIYVHISSSSFPFHCIRHDMSVCYEPLNPAKAEIRLLRLSPGTEDKPIRCSLKKVSLDSHPVFEALSYIWGDTAATTPITVNKCPFTTMENLHSALVHLRHRWTPRVLWVDAICINQADSLEKSSQILSWLASTRKRHRSLPDSGLMTRMSGWPSPGLRGTQTRNGSESLRFTGESWRSGPCSPGR
jgi:hypothetical protein